MENLGCRSLFDAFEIFIEFIDQTIDLADPDDHGVIGEEFDELLGRDEA